MSEADIQADNRNTAILITSHVIVPTDPSQRSAHAEARAELAARRQLVLLSHQRSGPLAHKVLSDMTLHDASESKN